MSYHVFKADYSTDKNLILDFWNQHNKKKLDNKFSWIYQSNPHGVATTWLLRHEDDTKIVGMASVFPRVFRYRDKTFTAGIQGDFFVDNKHRSFGPALMLIREIINSVEELDYHFLFAFPNKNAEPIFRRAGYTQLGRINKYTRLFDLSRLLSEKNILPQGLVSILSPVLNQITNIAYPDAWIFNYGRYDIEITKSLDCDLDDLMESYHQNTFSTHKSKEYISWKYEKDPDDTNLYFLLKENNKVVGYIVFCVEEDRFVYLREIIHNQTPVVLSTLLALFFKKVKNLNCEYAYAQIYEKSNLLLSANNLDLAESKQDSKLVYLVNKGKKDSESVDRLIKSRHFNLFKSDEDS
jgi:predicted N-acetyltransferase YhbS